MPSTFRQFKTNIWIYSSKHLLISLGLEVIRYENKKWLKSREEKPHLRQTAIKDPRPHLFEQFPLSAGPGGRL
jgi:hypothetical protein